MWDNVLQEVSKKHHMLLSDTVRLFYLFYLYINIFIHLFILNKCFLKAPISYATCSFQMINFKTSCLQHELILATKPDLRKALQEKLSTGMVSHQLITEHVLQYLKY